MWVKSCFTFDSSKETEIWDPPFDHLFYFYIKYRSHEIVYFLGRLSLIVVVRHHTDMRLVRVYNMAWPTCSLPITDVIPPVLVLCWPLGSIQRCTDSQSKFNLPGYVFGLLSLLLVMYSANAQVLSRTRTEKKSFRLACSHLMQPFSFMSSSSYGLTAAN